MNGTVGANLDMLTDKLHPSLVSSDGKFHGKVLTVKNGKEAFYVVVVSNCWVMYTPANLQDPISSLEHVDWFMDYYGIECDGVQETQLVLG